MVSNINFENRNYVIGDQGNELFKACYRFIFTDEGSNYEILKRYEN